MRVDVKNLPQGPLSEILLWLLVNLIFL
jgi:hypothetical protein